MDKEQILTKIQDCGIVAVVRAESADQASRIADACIEGGVAAIELTFTVPHADKVIEELAKRYTPEQMILGAGTVMDAPTARIAMLSGANFVVSPYFDPETVKMCNRYRVAVMPGIMTVKEAGGGRGYTQSIPRRCLRPEDNQGYKRTDTLREDDADRRSRCR